MRRSIHFCLVRHIERPKFDAWSAFIVNAHLLFVLCVLFVSFERGESCHFIYRRFYSSKSTRNDRFVKESSGYFCFV